MGEEGIDSTLAVSGSQESGQGILGYCKNLYTSLTASCWFLRAGYGVVSSHWLAPLPDPATELFSHASRFHVVSGRKCQQGKAGRIEKGDPAAGPEVSINQKARDLSDTG